MPLIKVPPIAAPAGNIAITGTALFLSSQNAVALLDL